MDEITIFGKVYPIIEEDTNGVHINQQQVTIPSSKRRSDSPLKAFLAEMLIHKLEEIAEKIRAEGRIDILGNLDFKIEKRIDSKKNRIAKLKGNRIIFKLDAIALPENILRYIVAHEIAHIENKRHTVKFWKTVELICPDFREAHNRLTEIEALEATEKTF